MNAQSSTKNTFNNESSVNEQALTNHADSSDTADSISQSTSVLLSHCGTRKVSREELKLIPVPNATRTHQPLSHYEITEVLEEALSFRYLRVVRDEYAVSEDGMKMFGVMDLSAEFGGCRFSIGLRNSNDKSMRLALTAGLRVFVCDNLMFSGDFSPLLHKHTRKLDLLDAVSIAVDRIQRGFAPLQRQITDWQETALSDDQVKLIIYEAFLDKRLKVPKHLMTLVHQNYFHPQEEAFKERTFWSLSNAFTSAFKKLIPIAQFAATAKLGTFLTEVSDRLPDEVLERLYGPPRAEAEVIPFKPYLIGASHQSTAEMTDDKIAESEENINLQSAEHDDDVWDWLGGDDKQSSFDSDYSVDSEQSVLLEDSELTNADNSDKIESAEMSDKDSAPTQPELRDDGKGKSKSSDESVSKPNPEHKSKVKTKPKPKVVKKRLKVAA